MIWPSASWVNEGCFSLLGMAGLISGMLQAPLTAIFLIVEITGGYEVILPLIIISAISTTVCHFVEPASFYLRDLFEKGHLLRPGTDARVLSDLKIHELLEKDCITVKQTMMLRDFIEVLKKSHRNLFPVEDEETGRFLGIIHLDDIRPYLFNPGMYDAVFLGQIMDTQVEFVSPDDDVSEVLHKMDKNRLFSIPVIENDRFVGLISKATLLQSIYFCSRAQATPVVYIPKSTQFLLYFENDVIQVDLDDSYLNSPETALEHATKLIEQGGLKAKLLEPKTFTATNLPDIPTNFDYMCCPRSISDLSSKIGLGYIGPRVRRIVQSARFPVLIASPVYKEWKSIAVLFGGSANAVSALRLGLRIRLDSKAPIEVFTQLENRPREHYEKVLEDENLDGQMERVVDKWHVFEKGNFEDNLYEVPHDALVVLGAYGHGLIKDFIFGSKMENIQSTISNNLLIVGPQYSESS